MAERQRHLQTASTCCSLAKRTQAGVLEHSTQLSPSWGDETEGKCQAKSTAPRGGAVFHRCTAFYGPDGDRD
jgi:hypothetical protein